MILRVIQKGPAGSKLKVVSQDNFDVEGAILCLDISLREGFQVLECAAGKIMLERHSSNYRHATYETYTGPAKEMNRLVSIARTDKVASAV